MPHAELLERDRLQGQIDSLELVIDTLVDGLAEATATQRRTVAVLDSTVVVLERLVRDYYEHVTGVPPAEQADGDVVDLLAFLRAKAGDDA